MDLGIEGRVALVLGASRGLGRAIAESLGREGARVALAARSADGLDEVAGGIASETAVLAADTGDEDAVATLPARVDDALGPVEILVLNTGGPPAGGALDADADEWRAAYQSLVLAPVVLAQACVPGMRERGWGRIVSVSSTSVREPIPSLALSNSNRMATVGLAQHARARRSRATGSPSTRSRPDVSAPIVSSSCTAQSRRPRSGRGPTSRPLGSGARRSTATSSRSSARSAPAT